MDLQVFYDKKHGYTAVIENLGIVTEGDNFDEMMYNLNEAIELAQQDNKQTIDISSSHFQLSFIPTAIHASHIQTSYKNS